MYTIDSINNIQKQLHITHLQAKQLKNTLKEYNGKEAILLNVESLSEVQIDEITELFKEIIIDSCNIRLQTVIRYWMDFKFYSVKISDLYLYTLGQ